MILAAIDFSEGSDAVIEQAKALAKAMSTECHLLHVASPDPDFVGYEVGPQSVRDSMAEKFHEEHRQLHECAEGLHAEGIEATPLLVQGPTVEKILSEADRLAAGIIVVGSHGKGALQRALVGSTSEGVLHGASVPVLVVPTHGRK